MITPNQSEILGLSLRTIIKCCTKVGTLPGRSRLSETGNQLFTCSHSVCSGYTEIQWQFLPLKIVGKSDLGTEITVPLDKQGCSSLDQTVQVLFSLGEGMGPAASPGFSATADPGEKEYRAPAVPMRKWLRLQTETCLGDMKQQLSLPSAQLFISTYHQPSWSKAASDCLLSSKKSAAGRRFYTPG